MIDGYDTMKNDRGGTAWKQVRLMGLAGALIGMLAADVFAQPAAAAKQKKNKYENLMLNTKDGVRLSCSYYPGADSKSTVPIILLHDWDGSRAQMHPLALGLQGLKYAVIVPDLRGHGRSTMRRGADRRIDRDKMKPDDIKAMLWDVEAVKSFLLRKNNEEKLNIEELCVVGTGFGSLLAMNWAVLDWNARPLPAYKMGQDVKALILVSPMQSFKGMTSRPALAHPIIRKELPIMVIVGADDQRSYADAKRIYRSFERFHNKEKSNLVLYAPATSLQGVRLVYARGLKVGGYIAQFIKRYIARRADLFPWRDRTSPLSN